MNFLLTIQRRNRGKQRDRREEGIQKIYKRGDKNHKDNKNSLTSWQLVILETIWAPWQHRMNPARLRSTHTTDSRTNTLTWIWKDGGWGVDDIRKGR